MPILIKDYSWRQTEQLVEIRIPFKGVSPKKSDIFTSNNYLKIHCPPFLFEVCLWGPVVEEESVCTLASDEAVFRLVKETAGQWQTLAAELSRHEALAVKTKAVEEAQVRNQQQRKELLVKKNERQRAAVKEQICLNTRERELIEYTKERERKAALAQMGWSQSTITEITDELQEDTTCLRKSDKEIFKTATTGRSGGDTFPAPRQMAQIPVTFTPRSFPTPCRESKLVEEQEWLCKQAETRRRTGFVAEDLRPEEQDPIWLCEKAESFYAVGNYLGAVSAYTHALTVNSSMYQIYAGRSTAQLALGNLHRAIDDSSKALELLTPAVPQNAEARAQCLLCRGKALARLGLKPEAMGELQAAANLKPDCLNIQAAILHLQDEAAH